MTRGHDMKRTTMMKKVLLSLTLESAGLFLRYIQTGESSVILDPLSGWRITDGNFFAFASTTFARFLNGPDSLSILGLGIAVLILTPYVRIMAAVVYYAIERDVKYFTITASVLTLITAALLVF